MSTAPPPVTRFAPSPTGMLHVGGARTALFAWAYARGRGGTFLLRLEDTDRKRSSDASARAIVDDLRWLGLDWDNDGDVPTQSARHEQGVYNAAVDRLLEAGRAYEDDGAVRFRMDQPIAVDDAVFGRVEYAADDLEDFIIRKGEAGGGFPTFHLAVVVDDHDMGVTHVIRGAEHLSNTPKHAALCDALGYDRPTWAHIPSIQNPDGSKMSKRDKAKAARKAAKQAIDAGRPWEQIRDEALTAWNSVKSVGGGPPRDLSPEFFDQFLAGENDDLDAAESLARVLNIDLPEIDVRDFWSSGYLPGVLCNYLALLGWNPGGDVERFDLDFLKQRFDFDRVQKGPARFDREKLLAFNADTLQQMPPEDFAELLIEHLRNRHPALLEQLEGHFTTFAEQYQPRSQTLEDPAKLGRFFVEAPGKPDDYDAKAAKKWLHKNEGDGFAALEAAKNKLDAIADADWRADTIHAALEAVVAERGMKNLGGVAQPLRMAVTGTPVSPEIGPTLEILGKAETLTRIRACLSQLHPREG